ncbi:hypothetical protein [Bacillus sp. NPDC094106]|uniref:hypothetical protein n=1 Tax=Bacillus sp. NPDC094106 TaxID=3363949 RepID=UPI00380C70AF
MIKPTLYKGLTKEGKWVYGNLVYTTDCEIEHQAIIIPTENNGMYTQENTSHPISESDREYLKEMGKTKFETNELGFETWYAVDIQTVELICDENQEDLSEQFSKNKGIQVTKEIADALDELLEMCKHNIPDAVDEYFEMRFEWEEQGDSLQALTYLGTDRFIRAMYFCYKIETL